MPDLVVEVVSPDDSARDLFQKINDFLSVGVPLIWIIDPDTFCIYIQRGNGTAQRLRVGDVLDGEEVIPGFRCEVCRIFA